MQTAATAAKAYASLASINNPTAAAAKSVQDAAGQDFGAMLNNVMSTASLGNPASRCRSRLCRRSADRISARC